MKKTGYDVSKVWAAEKEYMNSENHALFHAPRGNSKTGAIPAWNLLPGCTCSPEACGHCLKEGCYALKNLLRAGYDIEKNGVLRAWTENTVLCKTDLAMFEYKMSEYLAKEKPQFFRIHASGDFFSVEYAQAWHNLAKHFPNIKFLAFTKQWEVIRKVDFSDLDNFALVLSGWTGCRVPDDLSKVYPVAWCDDGEETRIPENAIECPGNCDTCGVCWNLRKLGRHVKFHKH